ncbi:MAG TPA: BON domain-containing protein [Burkholderiales bacterium]|nr:BON domain-containing protein [Burkholderiales bacterium]
MIGLLVLVPLLHGCFVAAAAGVGATALMAEDRRSSGIYLEDQNIEVKLASAVREKYGQDDKVQIKGTSFNRFVLLNGEVPSEEIKKDVGVMALGVESVRNVQNEIVVAPPASLTQSSSDTLTTSKVKSRFVTENRFQPNHVKVVTRGDTVYLMGLVTAKEADDATEIARTTGGVQKVVRVFEITENP